MPPKFWEELEIKNNYQGKGEISLKFSVPDHLEITTPVFLLAENLEKLLYSIYHKLNYCFEYLSYQIKVKEPNFEINKNDIEAYITLACTTPFLWNNKPDWLFFIEQKPRWEKFTWRQNTIYLSFSTPQELADWKPKLTILKEILGKLGLAPLRFSLKLKNEAPINNSEKAGEKKNNLSLTKFSLAQNNKKKLNKLLLYREWKERKIYELGVHTNFSTLDGISTPLSYIETAREKNYAVLAVTDHYNVQNFPEFGKHQFEDLKIIYGCELEMLEDDLPPYIFNHHSELNKKLIQEKITDLTYCVFDLETTGFFSEYNEIIEIGYAVYQQGKIVREGEYLVCPQQEIAREVLDNWYTSIDPQELKNAPPIQQVLPLLQKDWQGCILVAHNARNFDYGFLNKVWKENLGVELPYPVIDTLPLSWILLPERKSYSLEKLSHVPGRAKVAQAHRALADSKLLGELLEKLVKILGEKNINYWPEVKQLINGNYFPNRGHKIKVLVQNQNGLNNLYRLITISHTQRLFKNPCVFRSDLVKHRSGLLVGASGGQEGEIFTLFSSYRTAEKRNKVLKFYDYVEVNSPVAFSYLWLNGQIREEELKSMLEKIINTVERLGLLLTASHNVHYCQKKEKKLKEIIVANEGMGGRRHYLYKVATLEEKEDRFSNLPAQHLLSLEEMLENWLFLGEKKLLERLVFHYPQKIANRVDKVTIHQPPLNYSIDKGSQEEEKELINAYTHKANEIFGTPWPEFVQQRIVREWQIIQGRYVFIYWLAYKVSQKTQQDGYLVGSRGSIGSSLVARLCGITDLNPLPFYKFCWNCRYSELYSVKAKTYSCYDYTEKENCPRCSSPITVEGHNLPFETFFGWEGEKTPDIDLNFSGEYQRKVHDYVRQLLGADSVYRIGTINTLSQQTAEIFYKEHAKLRKKLNPNWREEKWSEEWIDWKKIQELQKKLVQVRQEKEQLEITLKKMEAKE